MAVVQLARTSGCGPEGRRFESAQPPNEFLRLILLFKMNFSICIPTLNEEKYLPLLLNCLLNQDYQNFEVIISDGGSVDKTLEVAKKYQNSLNLKILKNSQKGVSFQRNSAASLSKFDNLIFLDADTQIQKDFLLTIKNYLQKHPEIGALTSYNIPISNNLIDKIVFWFFNVFILNTFQKISPIAVGTFIYAKKEAFNKIGGFDNNLTYGEDVNLVKRIAKAGYKFKVLKKPPIYFSVRRLKEEGRIKFFAKSIYLGIFYVLRNKKFSNSKIKYEFGKHQ